MCISMFVHRTEKFEIALINYLFVSVYIIRRARSVAALCCKSNAIKETTSWLQATQDASNFLHANLNKMVSLPKSGGGRPTV